MKAAGADEIYCLGGVQALAAMAYGMEGAGAGGYDRRCRQRLCGRGRGQLFGHVGIDLLAGPTEILVLIDDTADPYKVAADILGQAEHDPNSRQALVSLSRPVAEKVMAEIEAQLKTLPTREIAAVSWGNNGEVILVDSPEEAVSMR